MRSSRRYAPPVFARLVRTSPARLAYYREIDLLPWRAGSCRRVESYDENDLLRVQRIRIGRGYELSLEEIRAFLDEDATPVGRRCSVSLDELFQRGLRAGRPPTRRTTPNPFGAECRAILEALEAAAKGPTALAPSLRREAAERFHRHLERWFCRCSPERFRTLARRYVGAQGLMDRFSASAACLRRPLLCAVEALSAAPNDPHFVDCR